MKFEKEPILMSSELEHYIGNGFEGDVPGVIKEILELSPDETKYANFFLEGPRQVQPHFETVAAIFLTESGQREIGIFPLLSTANTLTDYLERIRELEIPERVRRIDADRFFVSENYRKQYLDTTLFPHLQKYRMPLVVLAFGKAFVQKELDVVYMAFPSDIRTYEALGFLKEKVSHHSDSTDSR